MHGTMVADSICIYLNSTTIYKSLCIVITPNVDATLGRYSCILIK